MKKIAVLGANPAWQKTLCFDSFQPGKVNRAISLAEFASGKGINFCRAAMICGKSQPVLFQFAGKENGKRLIDSLNELGIKHISVKTATPTRCCTTILSAENNSTTECIEPSYAVSSEEADLLLRQAEDMIPKCSIAAICGSLPGKTDFSVYSRFAEIAKTNDILLLVDAVNGLDGMLKTQCRMHLKVNKDELFQITGINDIKSALKQLFSDIPSLATAAITDGAEKSFASDGKTLFVYDIPKLDSIVSTLGCGDTASAVYCSFLADGTAFETAFRKALAAACANCLTPLCGEYLPAEADRIEQQIYCTSEKL